MVTPLIEKKQNIKMFLDFDKKINRFYINYYFKEAKFLMKELLIRDKDK